MNRYEIANNLPLVLYDNKWAWRYEKEKMKKIQTEEHSKDEYGRIAKKSKITSPTFVIF